MKLKVFVDFMPYPQNKFVVMVNDLDYFKLVKKEIGQALPTMEEFNCILTINREKTYSGSTPWIFDYVEDKISAAHHFKPL